MPGHRMRLAAPRRLLLLFALVLLLPAAAVAWLGVRLIQQDRELESRQLAERRQTAADRAVALLEQALASTERRLLTVPPDISIPPADDAVLVTLGSGGIEATPRDHLLYYPPVDAPSGDSDIVFDAGERLEYQQQDYAGAVERYRMLARSSIASIRAGALMRLARNQRRLGKRIEALRTYTELSSLGDAQVAGLPADLVARRARCALFNELGLTADRQHEAHALRRDLLNGTWRLSRGAFLAYTAETAEWSGDTPGIPNERLAIAAAVQRLADSTSSTADGERQVSGRRTLRLEGVPLVVLSQSSGLRTVALVAGPAFQRREWFSVLEDQPGRGPFTLTIADAEGVPLSGRSRLPAAVRRTAAESGLPWTLMVGDNDSPVVSVELRDRRRTIVLTLALVGLVVFAGGAFTVRALSRELAAAQLQADFVSAVSHEFRTPLTSLRQFTDLLNDEVEPPALKRRTFYQAQARATERLHRLVESLLDFGRMQAGVRPYRLIPMSLNEFVRGVVDDFSRDGAPVDFRIQATFSDTPIAIDADPEALARAIRNLLDNAIKYSGEGRIVRVAVAMQQASAAVSVTDEGIGIPRAEHARIFEKFVRGAATRESQIAGTGIGLAMVRHIARAHGGDVSVESGEREGSTFTLVLPARRDTGAFEETASSLDRQATDTGASA